jgi:hypothetical protein
MKIDHVKSSKCLSCGGGESALGHLRLRLMRPLVYRGEKGNNCPAACQCPVDEIYYAQCREYSDQISAECCILCSTREKRNAGFTFQGPARATGRSLRRLHPGPACMHAFMVHRYSTVPYCMRAKRQLLTAALTVEPNEELRMEGVLEGV